MKRKMSSSFARFHQSAVIILLMILSYTQANAQCYSQPNYCIPSVTNVNSYSIGLQNVTMGSTINNSTSATGNAPNYSDYTNLSVTGKPGTVINFSVKNGGGNSTKAYIFIDWNQDGTFNTSSPEQVWISPTTTAGATVSDTFSIPSGTAAGVYRVRVTGDFGGSASGKPCQLNYGEVEDYSLVVTSSTADGLAFAPVSPTTFYAGSDTIRFSMFNLTDSAMNSVDIGYQLDNNSPVTQSLSNLSVAAGRMYVATFDTLLNLSSAGTYTLKMWLNNVNGAGTQTASNDTICRTFVICTTPLSGSYTIDPNGSGSSNFVTFNDAVTKLINCGITGPVYFAVSADSFPEQIRIPNISGSSSTNTITFEGVDSSTSVISFDGVTGAPHTILLDGAQYITFRKMKIKANGTAYAVPVYLANASYNVISNCLLEISKANTNNNAAGVVFSGSSQAFASKSDCKENYIDSNRIYGGYYNIYHAGNNGSVNNYMRRNKFQNAYYYGIYQNSSSISTNKIIGNTFEMASNNGNSHCIYLINGTPSAGYKHEIKENIFLRTGQYHIYILTSQGGSNANNAGEIYNNFFGGTWNSTGTAGCINMWGQYWKIYHNSFNMTGSASTSYCFSVYGGTNNIDFQNNILSNTQTGGTNLAADIANNGSVSNSFDYNMMYTAGTNVFRVGGVNYQANNLSSNAYPNGAGIHSFFQAPTYVSKTNLHISAICNNGNNLNVSTDIDGDSRSSSPDIGADENSNAPSVDVAVMSIVSPAFPVASGSQTLSVLVKNTGKDSVSSLKVYYDLNNSLDSETFTFSPALQICDTATVTFTNNISIGSGYNNLKVYVAYAGDSFASNDTINRTFCVAMAGNYTINSNNSASNTNFTSFTAAVNQLMCSGVSAAVAFDVSADTYTEQIDLGVIQGLSSTNTVSFIGHGKDSTVLTYSASANTAPHTFRINGAKYIIVRNMNIQATGQNNGWALNILNATYIKVAGCKIECAGNAASSASSNLAAVVLNGGATSITTTGSCDRNEIDTNIINGGYYGIVSAGAASSNINYYRNNKISNSYYAGIYIYSSQCAKVLNNKVSNRSSNTNSLGIYFFASSASANQSNSYHEVSGNFVNNVGQYGIYLNALTGGSGAANNKGLCYNNMIGGSFSGTAAVYGLAMSTAYYWNVYHNSVGIATSTGTSHRAFYLTGYSYRDVILNNSFAVTNANASGAIAADINITGGNQPPDSLNFNNYYNANNSNLVGINGTNYTSSTYLAAYPNGGGAQSFDGDPGYYTANDLHATGTQLDNRAQYLGVTTDIDDDTRSTTTPDIGADEYYANTKQDLAANKIINPVAAGCLGGYNMLITASIKNMGVDTVDLTNDTAWVSAEVTDPNSNIITYGPMALTGIRIDPKTAVNVDITNQFDMSDIGTYFIRPYVYFHSDTNALNDTMQAVSFDETNPVPILSFIPTTSICSNDSIKLSAVDSKNTSDFQWYYNGSPINGATDSVYYATQAGDYWCNVADNYYSGCDVNSDTITIKVGKAPTATFTPSKISFCAGDSSLLTAQGGSANNYQWLYNNTVIQGANDSIYYAKAAGTYAVVVQDKTSGCAALSSTSKLTVYATPNANVSFAGSGVKCMGDSIKLSSVPGSGLTYQWWMNGNKINGANDSIYYAKASGNYQVEISNTNGCAATSTAASVTIDSLPDATVIFKGNNQACGLDTVYMDATNVNANYTYQWMDGANTISGATSASYMTYVNGSFTVKVTNTNGCSSTSTAVVVAYRAVPATPSLNGNASSTICPGDSIRISAVPQAAGTYTYQWQMNGNNVNGAVDSFLYISAAGSYTASVTNSVGCTSAQSSAITLALYTAPSPTLTAGGNNVICAGDSVSLTAANTNTGLASVAWTLNSNALSTTANPIYAKSSGSYIAKVTDNNGCKAATSAVNVFVNPLPVPVISQDIPNNELSTTTSFTTYQWYKNGVAISGATSQKLKVYSNGDYTVEVTDANGCKGMSAASTVTWGGVAHAKGNINLNVYPNPSQGIFNIEMPTGVDMKQVYITDVTGKQIVTNTVQMNKNIYTVDLSEKAAGVYVLHLNYAGQTSQVRLIKY